MQLGASAEEPGTLLVNEGQLAGAGGTGTSAILAAGEVQAWFTHVVGADGEGSIGYSLVLQSGAPDNAGVPSGLYALDPQTPNGKGAEITLTQDKDVITGSANGVSYFSISIAPGTGAVTLTQWHNLWHDGSSNHDTVSLTLAPGVLTLAQTVIDGDGDSAVASVDLGVKGVFSFEDDGPTASVVNATKVLDDEGLINGINGGPGDVGGAATSTSGSLGYLAGTDGLRSVVLTGPAQLGSESVTSSWDANTRTLTISSERGALMTVVLTDQVTGAYTVNLLKPLMHPIDTAHADIENNIPLSIGYTVTDNDGDQASGSLAVIINDDSPTIQAGNIDTHSYVTFEGTDASYKNSYGYYEKALDGTPITGKVIWANVHNQNAGSTFNVDGLDPAKTGFFIIPNGGANAGLNDGAGLTFQLTTDGKWQALLNGHPLTGADGANVLFSDASLNPGGSHLQDTGQAGNQNWEDSTDHSDYDYNDVSTSVTWGSLLQVDESTLNTPVSADLAGLFNVQAGADGLKSQTWQLTVQDVNSGLVDTLTGQKVILGVNSAGSVEGRTASGKDLVFTLSIDGSGRVTLELVRAIVHPTNDPDEARFLGAGHVSLGTAVTDGDGDIVTAAIDIGRVISFKDDGPRVELAAHAPALGTVTVDESLPQLGGNGSDGIASATLAATLVQAQFSHVFGADGYGSIGYSLQLNGSNVASGLYAVDPLAAHGQGTQIVLNQQGDVITGSVGNANGLKCFTLTLDPVSGAVTLCQLTNLWQGDTHNPDDGVSLVLGSGVLTLVQTVTDGDGDRVSKGIDLAAGAGVFRFEDDGPSLGNFTSAFMANEPLTSVKGFFDIAPGADGLAALGITGPALAGLSYAPLSIERDANGKLMSTTLLATSGGQSVFSLTLFTDGTYQFNLIGADVAHEQTFALNNLQAGGPKDFLETPGGAGTPPGLIEFTGAGINSSNRGFGLGNQFVGQGESFTMEFHNPGQAGDNLPSSNPQFVDAVTLTNVDINGASTIYWTAVNTVLGLTQTGHMSASGTTSIIDPSISFNELTIKVDSSGQGIRFTDVTISTLVLPPNKELSFDIQGTDGDGDTTVVSTLDVHVVSGGSSYTLNGTDGDDVLAGSAKPDVINGHGGTDLVDYSDDASAHTINLATGRGYGGTAEGDIYSSIEGAIGGSGNDILIGDTGDNLLIGGKGSDTLTGGGGQNIFKWLSGEADGSTDKITDFTASAGDVLDLSDLLDKVPSGADNSELASNLDGYLKFNAANHTLTIDTNGHATGGGQLVIDFENAPVLSGTNQEIIKQLLDDGNLKVDPHP